jgi:hypothetical protein
MQRGGEVPAFASGEIFVPFLAGAKLRTPSAGDRSFWGMGLPVLKYNKSEMPEEKEC